ncbi:olfactory receptor 6E1-like [Vicugna pacos]|uniref:Olfactory receptor 6E1-like n=1 Tax=Vicugna pacos TaxID=30538 RepID=A0ABM5DGF0_VICPA
MGNLTTVTELILLGLSDACELQMLIFLGLLMTYLLTLLGNLLIMVITLMDRRLHTPMYYFLRNFAILEICFTSVIFPKMLTNILTGHKTISLAGCLLQMFLYFFLGTTEFFLLAVMSFDSCIFMYVRSGKGSHGEDRNKVVALLNTVVTPMLNPFIYTLRNKQVQQVFKEKVKKLIW